MIIYQKAGVRTNTNNTTGTNYYITPKNTVLHSYIATFTLYQSTKHTIHVVQKIYSKIKHKKLFHYNTVHTTHRSLTL